MNFPEEFISIKEVVEAVLKEVPASRNSDKDLFYYVLTLKCGVIMSYEDFNNMWKVKYATVERVRQLLQAEGKYLPTDPEVLAQRTKNQVSMTHILSEYKREGKLNDESL
jgi:hypothetical protein